MAQYLVINKSALGAQSRVAKKRMGYTVDDADGNPLSIYVTENPFEVINHPTDKNMCAVVIRSVSGMKDGEPWCRGKKPNSEDIIDNLFATNKPLKDSLTSDWYE